MKETYQAILDDLDYAIRECAETSPNHYVNKWVAMGQKVRVLMARGQEGDYAEAAKLAKDIIEQGPYQLEAHTTDIFHSVGLASEEVMFGVKPQNRGGQQTSVMEAYYYRNSAQFNYTDNFYALFEGDPRKEELALEGKAKNLSMNLMMQEIWSDIIMRMWLRLPSASTSSRLPLLPMRCRKAST